MVLLTVNVVVLLVMFVRMTSSETGVYVYHATPVDYTTARTTCTDNLQTLVMPRTPAQLSHILDFLNDLDLYDGSRTWIGLDAIEESRVFRWVDGEVLGGDSWTFWNSPAQPSYTDNQGREERCVHMLEAGKSFRWNDARCTAKFGFLCEGEGLYMS